MKSPKPLKELPGFDQALADAKRYYPENCIRDYSVIGEITIPALKRITHDEIRQLAQLIGTSVNDERRRIRLVPASRTAANDCEEVQHG